MECRIRLRITEYLFGKIGDDMVLLLFASSSTDKNHAGIEAVPPGHDAGACD